jgi:hypothetical protein
MDVGISPGKEEERLGEGEERDLGPEFPTVGSRRRS